MASVRPAVRVLVVPILLASLVLMGSGVMASGAASASPSSCYPPGSTSCPGKLKAVPSPVLRGGTVTVSGKGFNAGAKVSINVCNVTKITTYASNKGITGQISVQFTMPDRTPFGACKFTATGLGSNKQTLTLTVTVIVKSATNTVLKLSPAKVTYGNEQVEQESVTVSPEFPAPVPTGTVMIAEGKLITKGKKTTEGKASPLCMFTLSKGKGSCGLLAGELFPGTYYIVATYYGNLKFVGSFAKETLTVVKS